MTDTFGPDEPTALERLTARDEIRQLVYRYALAIDSRDIDLLVSLFVPDVRVGREGRGRSWGLGGKWSTTCIAEPAV